MKASGKRNLVRWVHIAVGGIIATYIYSPIGEIFFFQVLTKAVIIPLTILSGLWLWKGHLLRRQLAKAKKSNTAAMPASLQPRK